MSAVLESIRYHRNAMIKSRYGSDAYFFHRTKAAEFTKVWRQANTLRAVQ